MANDRKTDALSTLRARLADHARDPRASMLGLSTTLTALSAAMDEMELRTATLAAFMLRYYYWPNESVHAAQLQALASMGEHAAALHRTAAALELKR